MSEDGTAVSFWEESTRLLFVGLSGWVIGGVGAFVALSASGIAGGLHSDGMRAVTLTTGFGLGALALLAYGTFRVVRRGGVAALVFAVGLFVLPPAAQVVVHAASLGAGLLVLLAAHAAAAVALAARGGGQLDRVLVPEAALLLLALGLAVTDLSPGLAGGLG